MTTQQSKTTLWAGRILSAVPTLFMIVDSVFKLLRHPTVIEGTAKLGYPEHSILTMGILGLASALLYAFPRTAVLGAILLTGYFGGAVATHVRVDDPLFSHILFPTYLGVMVWGGLYLRDVRLRALLPIVR